MKYIKYIIIILIVLLTFGCGKEKEPVIRYYCEDEDILVGNICRHIIITDPIINYTCASGNLVGNQCVTEYRTLAQYEYVCSYGYTKKYSYYCVDKNGVQKMATKKYYCYYGELDGTQCVTKNYYPAGFYYTCPMNYTLIDNECIGEEYYSAYSRIEDS